MPAAAEIRAQEAPVFIAVTLQKPLKQLARRAVQRRHVAHAVLHTLAACDQQRVAAEAANVLFALQDKRGHAAVSFYRPDAGCG